MQIRGKRFKILSLLALELDIEHLNNKMEELAEKIDSNHPMAVEALEYYENNIIEILSASEKELEEKVLTN